MKLKRTAAVLLTCTMVLWSITGCSGGKSSESTAEPSAKEASETLAVVETSAEEVTETEPSGDVIKIGISVPALSNPFWRSFADFGEAAAKELGMEVVVVDANQNDSTQLDQIMGLVSSGVQGIVITPNTSSIATSLLLQCDTAGVKVVMAERYPGFSPEEYEGDSYVGYIGVDNTLAGYNIAKSLYDAGCRNIVAVSGVAGGATADERSAGLKKFVDEHPDMKLLQELRNAEVREDGLKDAEDFLSAYPDGFDGVWCYNDDSAMGVIQALTNAGLNGKIKVAGMDLIDEAVAAIQAGDMQYSTGGQWAESAGAVIMLYDALKGFEPDPALNEIEIPGVTAETVDAYFEQFVNSVPEYDLKALSKTTNPEAKTTDFTIELKMD